MVMQTDSRPARSFVAVTPSDTVNLVKRNGEYPRAVFFGAAGDYALVGEDDGVEVFKGMAAGTFLPVCVKRVNSTGSTVLTDIKALY